MKPVNQKFTVCDVFWERVFLNIEIKADCNDEPTFFFERIGRPFVKSDENIDEFATVESVELKIDKKTEDGNYKLCINIPAVKGRSFLDNGAWILVAYCGQERNVCALASDVAYTLQEKTRVFPYGDYRFSYNISFGVCEKGENAVGLVIYSYFMKINDKWKKRPYGNNGNILLRLFLAVFLFFLKVFYRVMSAVFPKNGKHILLMSESKKQISGNLKAIDDELKKLGLDKKYRISYSFREYESEKKNVLKLIPLFFKIAKQDYIFVDDYAHVLGFFDLNKKTKLIQVWHAGEGFKAVGYCRFGKDGSPFPTGVCHRKYDYAVSPSESLVRVFAEVFGIEEESFLPVGMPRLDSFTDESRIEAFKEKFYSEYPSFAGKRIILFAPTYRGTNEKYAFYNSSWLDLKRIYSLCSDNSVFLIKMHPFVKSKIEIPEEYADRIIDFSHFGDINSLYYVTDLLITDYSSNYYEYLMLKKPCIFYTPDREIYELTRGVHRSILESAPGKVCDTFDELVDAIANSDFETEKSLKFAEDNFSGYDGHATEKIIEKVLGYKE